MHLLSAKPHHKSFVKMNYVACNKNVIFLALYLMYRLCMKRYLFLLLLLLLCVNGRPAVQQGNLHVIEEVQRFPSARSSSATQDTLRLTLDEAVAFARRQSPQRRGLPALPARKIHRARPECRHCRKRPFPAGVYPRTAKLLEPLLRIAEHYRLEF